MDPNNELQEPLALFPLRGRYSELEGREQVFGPHVSQEIPKIEVASPRGHIAGDERFVQLVQHQLVAVLALWRGGSDVTCNATGFRD